LRLSVFKVDADPANAELAEGLEELTSDALESVRRLAYELRPPALDDLGLHDALEVLVQRFSDQLSIPVAFDAPDMKDRLSGETELVLYRIAQEALTNVAKHARATAAAVTLSRMRDNITLTIRDNGIGFDPARATRGEGPGLGLGMFGMQERAMLVRGTLSVRSRPGMGTEVSVRVPLDNKEHPALAPGALESVPA
jgi:signal transduction histidine kinase